MTSSVIKLQSLRICLRSMPCLAGSPAAAQSLMAGQHNSFSTAHGGASDGLAAFQPRCCSHWPTAMPAQGRSWSPLPWHMQLQAAHYASSGPQVKFRGSKLKPYTSYRERFKTTGSGAIVYQRPGHRHKRFAKGPKRNRQLRGKNVLQVTYAKTMKRLGFVARSY